MPGTGLLVAPTFVSMTNLRDVNDAAKADGYAVTWDSASAKHIYTEVASTAAVNTLLDGRSFKPSVRVATTAAGTLATSFENADTIDGVTLATGDRILIKDQAAATENGIYVVAASGAPTRATDLDTGDSAANSFVSVEEGTANESTAWICPENVGSDVVGTDTITFTNYAGIHVHDTGDITTGTFADGRIAESNVTQHEAALTITESQISDLGTYLTDITGEALSTLSDVTITSIASGELLTWNGSAWINETLAEAGISVTGHAHAAADITSGTLAHERGGIEADISAVAKGDVLAGTGTGTIGIVAASGASDGDVLTIQADGTTAYETPAGGGGGDAMTTGDVFTGVHDFGGADSLEIPNGAAPTVDAAGEIAVDTTIANYTGMIVYFDGTEALTVLAVPTANLSTTDGEVVAYNAANNELEFIDVVSPYVESTLGGAAAGDILYHTGTEWSNLAKGTDGDLLTLDSGLPSWASEIGDYSTTRGVSGAKAWASGRFAATGDAQSGFHTLRVQTTDATPTVLTSDGAAASATNIPIMADDHAVRVRVEIVARKDQSTVACYESSALFTRGTGAASVVREYINSESAFEDDSTWNINIVADTTNGGINVEVTGKAAMTIKWFATVWTQEVG
jgi:hypothetical protein